MKTRDPIPQAAGEYEALPVVGYDDYRTLCDEMQPDVYRKTGVASVEGYEAAQADHRTIYAEVDGHRLPLFVPLEHAGGYNIEGTRRLTERENVYTLALPLEFIYGSELDLARYLDALDEGSSVVVQTDAKYSDEAKAKVAEDLTTDDGWSLGEFVDPRVQMGPKTAHITAYVARFESHGSNGEAVPRNDRSLHELYEEDVAELGESDTKLVEATDLHARAELFNELWRLHGDKFDWLGKYHPVSMEEDKAFLEQLLDSDAASSFVRYATNKDGESVPRGHGIMIDGARADEVGGWIREQFIDKINAAAKSYDNASVVFYYGIASEESEEEGTKYAEDVMHLVSRLMNRRGGNALLVFESTNMSSQYIPMLIRKYTATEPKGLKMTGDSEPISQLDYWYLRSSSKETV